MESWIQLFKKTELVSIPNDGVLQVPFCGRYAEDKNGYRAQIQSLAL